jgi:hypothetical protein
MARKASEIPCPLHQCARQGVPLVSGQTLHCQLAPIAAPASAPDPLVATVAHRPRWPF